MSSLKTGCGHFKGCITAQKHRNLCELQEMHCLKEDSNFVTFLKQCYYSNQLLTTTTICWNYLHINNEYEYVLPQTTHTHENYLFQLKRLTFYLLIPNQSRNTKIVFQKIIVKLQILFLDSESLFLYVNILSFQFFEALSYWK